MLPLEKRRPIVAAGAVLLLLVMVACSRVISVTINEGDQTLVVGEAKHLTVTVVTAGSASRVVRWSSSAPGVASVSQTGLVTANAPGMTQIVAVSVSDDSQSDAITVTVEEPPSITAPIGPEGGAITLTDYASVTFPAAAFSAVQNVRVAVVVDPDDGNVRDWLDEHAAAIFNPDTKLQYLVRIETGSAQPATQVEVVLDVRQAFLASLSDARVGLFFAKAWYAGAEPGYAFDDFDQIGAIYDRDLGQIKATLFPSDFSDDRRDDGVFEAIVTMGSALTPETSAAHVVSPMQADHCPDGGLAPPLNIELDVSSGFGGRTSPTTGASTNHRGVDYRAPEGTRVNAANDGVVERVWSRDTGYGQAAIIRHPDGSRTLYAHLQAGSPGDYVHVGDQVQRGQQIARSGNTGTSSGPHLHFEYARPAEGTSVNGYFDQNNIRSDPHACITDDEDDDPGDDDPEDPARGGVGSSHGDPHIQTMDGSNYTFMAVGDYVLSRSIVPGDDFEVQVRYVPFETWGRQWSANGAVAAMIEGDRVEIHLGTPGAEIYVNGAREMGPFPHRLPGGGSIVTRPGAVVVSWPDATTLTARLRTNDIGSVTLFLPDARAGLVEGLLGDFDGDRRNDVRIRDGDVVTDHSQRNLYDGGFRDSWSVAQGASQSLFSQGVDPFDPDYPSTINSLTDFEASEINVARQTCIDRGVVDEALLDNCTLDLLVSGDDSWADVTAAVDPNRAAIFIVPSVAWVHTGGEREFQAVVSGTDHVGVTWSLDGPGTLVPDGADRATFEAPESPGMATITAALEAMPSVTAQAVVVVIDAPAVPAGVVATVETIRGRVEDPLGFGAFAVGLYPQTGEPGVVHRLASGTVNAAGELSVALPVLDAGQVAGAEREHFWWCGQNYEFVVGAFIISDAAMNWGGTPMRVAYLRLWYPTEAIAWSMVVYLYSLETRNVTCASDMDAALADVDVRIRPGWNVLAHYMTYAGEFWRTGEPDLDVPWMGPYPVDAW